MNTKHQANNQMEELAAEYGRKLESIGIAIYSGEDERECVNSSILELGEEGALLAYGGPTVNCTYDGMLTVSSGADEQRMDLRVNPHVMEALSALREIWYLNEVDDEGRLSITGGQSNE